ncbi:MAG: CBS domain-containing protein [Steroidobacteraceae bacterium]
MHVSKVMTQKVFWVGPDTTMPEIAGRMRSEDIGSVPVAENDRLIGMVTDRDIVVRVVAEGGDLDSTTARQVMSPRILYCFDDETVAAVLKNMGDNQVRRLPVVSRDKRLVGVISLGDLSRAAEKQAGGALKEISEPATAQGSTDAPGSSARQHSREERSHA